MARERIDALLVPADPFLFTERQRVAALAREHRLPGMYSTREYAEAGSRRERIWGRMPGVS